MATPIRSQMTLREAYRPRPVRFLGMWELGDWRLKAYGLAAEHVRLLPELVAAAKELAQRTLPERGGYGVGFAGIHSGRDANLVFVDWWTDENELHHVVFRSTAERPLELVRADGIGGCVWDLQVIWFERNAWVEKVLANAKGPDVEAYLRKVLSDDA